MTVPRATPFAVNCTLVIVLPTTVGLAVAVRVIDALTAAAAAGNERETVGARPLVTTPLIATEVVMRPRSSVATAVSEVEAAAMVGVHVAV